MPKFVALEGARLASAYVVWKSMMSPQRGAGPLSGIGPEFNSVARIVSRCDVQDQFFVEELTNSHLQSGPIPGV
jgi:hypothetical protein